MRRSRWFLLVLLTTLLLTAACGGGSGSGDDGVATLGGARDEPDDGSGGQGGQTPDPAFQDAVLEFAQCMRDHGVDMPDPEFAGGGRVMMRAGGGGDGPPSAADEEAMEAAQAACQPIMDKARAAMPAPDPAEQAERQDEALKFAQCMREHGIDMPDPTFEEGGRTTMRAGGSNGDFDPESEEFQEAQKACAPDGMMISGRTASRGDEG